MFGLLDWSHVRVTKITLIRPRGGNDKNREAFRRFPERQQRKEFIRRLRNSLCATGGGTRLRGRNGSWGASSEPYHH